MNSQDYKVMSTWLRLVENQASSCRQGYSRKEWTQTFAISAVYCVQAEFLIHMTPCSCPYFDYEKPRRFILIPLFLHAFQWPSACTILCCREMVKERQVFVKLSEALKLEAYFSRQCCHCAGSSQIFCSNLLGVFQAYSVSSILSLSVPVDWSARSMSWQGI